MRRRRLIRGAVLLAGGLVLIQAVPYGRDHTNPPVMVEPAWDAPVTRQLAVRACYDCHSNETVWPWYSHIAPMSWFVQRDVDEGREELNFSQWQREQEEADKAAETVRDGSMPPRQYLLSHSAARLTDAQLADLARGFAATLGDDD
ncbi:MAG: heme-binding domain-containing protein [Acidimicrobiia bacterium]